MYEKLVWILKNHGFVSLDDQFKYRVIEQNELHYVSPWVM